MHMLDRNAVRCLSHRRNWPIRAGGAASRDEEDSDDLSKAADGRNGTKQVQANAALASPDHALEPFVMPLGSPRPNTSFNRVEAIEKAKAKAFTQLTSPSRVPSADESPPSYERIAERHSYISREQSEKKNRLDHSSPRRRDKQATEMKHFDTRQRCNQYEQHPVRSNNRSTNDENENEQQTNDGEADKVIYNSKLKRKNSCRYECTKEKSEESRPRKKLSPAMLRRIRQQARSSRCGRHREHGDHSSGGSLSSSSSSFSISSSLLSSSSLSGSLTTTSSSSATSGTVTAVKLHPIVARTLVAKKKPTTVSPENSLRGAPTCSEKVEKDKKGDRRRSVANNAQNGSHNDRNKTDAEEDDIFSQLSPLSPSLTIPKSTLTQTKTTETKALKATAKPSLLNLHEKDSLTKKLRKNKQKSPRDPHRSSSARSSINDGDEIGRPRWSWSTHPDNNISSNNSKTSRTPSASKANLPPQIDVPIESTIVCGRCSSRRQLHERQPLLPDLVAALRDLRGPELLPSSAAVVPVYPIPPTAPSAFPHREQTVGIHAKQQQQGEDNVEREQGVDGPRSLSRSRSPSPSLADVATICHLARCSARGLAKHLSVDEATAQALSTALARAATAAKNSNDTNDSSVFQNTVDHSFARSASALSTASTTASRRNTPALPIAASVSPTTNHSVIADRTYYVLPMPVSRHISSTPEAAGTCVPHNSNSDRPRQSLSGADAAKEEEQKTICFNQDVLTSNASHQPPAAVVSHQHHYYYAIPPPAMPATSLSPMLSVLPPPSLLSSGASPQMLARPSLSQSEATKANTHNKHQEKGTENNDGDDKSNSDDNAFWLTREGNDSEHHSRSTRVSPLKGHTNSHNTRRSSSNNSVKAYLGRKEGEQPRSNATENQNELGIPHTNTPPKIAIHNTLSSSDKKAQEKGRSRSVSSVGSMPRRCFSFAPLTSGPSRSAQAEALSRRCRYLGEPTEAEKERFAIARRKLKIQKEEEWQRRLQQPSGEATIEGRRLGDFCFPLKEKERSHSSSTPSQFLFVDNSEETKERVLRERREANAKGNAFIHSSRATALSKTPNNDNAKASSAGSPDTINRKTPQSNSRQQTVSTAESTPSDSDKNNTETNTILGREDSGDSIEKREKATNNNELGISKNQNPPTIKRRSRVPKNNTFSYESSDGSEDRDDENHSSSRRRPSHPRPCSGSSREPSPKPRTGCALIPTSPPRMRPQ